MPFCEVCGKFVRRRRGIVCMDVAWLTCHDCWFRLSYPASTIKELMRIEKILAQLDAKYRQPYETPLDAVPPLQVLAHIKREMPKGDYEVPFATILSEWYGLPAVKYRVDPEACKSKTGEIWLACYHGGRDLISSRESNITYRTAFHEYFHHLHYHGLVKTNEEERDADRYAELCVKAMEIC